MLENYYTISLPTLPKMSDEVVFPQEVTARSPLRQRKHVERFARHFKREGRFDFVPFVATEDPRLNGWEPYVAYLFANEPDWYPRVYCGACCFRRCEYPKIGERWALQWVWLHPYFRGRGMLTAAWEGFHNKFGDFVVDPPLSRAMTEFLRKRDQCCICWQSLAGAEDAVCLNCRARFS